MPRRHSHVWDEYWRKGAGRVEVTVRIFVFFFLLTYAPWKIVLKYRTSFDSVGGVQTTDIITCKYQTHKQDG